MISRRATTTRAAWVVVLMTYLLTAPCGVAHGATLRNGGPKHKPEEQQVAARGTTQQQQEQQTEEDDSKPSSKGGGGLSSAEMKPQQAQHQFPTSYACPDPMPTLHGRLTNAKTQKEYLNFFRFVHMNYEKKHSPGTLKEENMLSTPLPEADFVLWGSAPGYKILMSAYNKDTHVEAEAKRGITFVPPPPPEHDFSKIEGVTELQGDHVVFVIDYHSTFAHILIDMLPTIAYLRETMPANTRLLLANARDRTRPILEQVDPEFAKRIDYIDCPGDCRNQMVHIRNGSLTAVLPQSSTRHMELLDHARRWFMEIHAPSRESLEQRTVVYYTRNNASAGHGRSMDKEEEGIMLQLIQDTLEKYNRPEKLVIFNGTESFLEQIALFQSANFVIGAHGGGLANLLLLLPTAQCEKRPVVLEFLNNPLTPVVQDGSFGRSYYSIYSSCPWVDYHHVLYDPSSREDNTFIKIDEFKDALQAIFEPPADRKE
jgi:hypothetical protein